MGNLTNTNIKIDKDVYEDIKAVALRKRITIHQAMEEAAKAYVKDFDKQVSEGLS